jgi:hypothetical protein
LKELAGFAASAGSGFSIHLAGAPWWAVMLVVLLMSCVFLVSLRMSYQHDWRAWHTQVESRAPAVSSGRHLPSSRNSRLSKDAGVRHEQPRTHEDVQG